MVYKMVVVEILGINGMGLLGLIPIHAHSLVLINNLGVIDDSVDYPPG